MYCTTSKFCTSCDELQKEVNVYFQSPLYLVLQEEFLVTYELLIHMLYNVLYMYIYLHVRIPVTVTYYVYAVPQGHCLHFCLKSIW